MCGAKISMNKNIPIEEPNNIGIPLFPAGIVNLYKAPKSFLNDLDLTQFTFEKYEGQTKLRTEKFNNILMQSGFEEVKSWVEECANDFLTNVLELEYEEFFLTESWLKISE